MKVKSVIITLMLLLASAEVIGQKTSPHFNPNFYEDYAIKASSESDTDLFVLQNTDTLANIQFLVFDFDKKIVGLFDKKLELLDTLTIVEKDIAMFISTDPHYNNYLSTSPYAYCGNNPLRYTDPDGRSTRVAQNEDGTYRVIGGELDKDRNIYLYTQDKDGNYTVQGNSIGISSSITSFYNSDANNGKGAWAVGSIINPKDQSGDNFLSNIFGNTPSMFKDYIANAGNGEKYDFKTTNGTDKPIAGIDVYRGMPIGGTYNGQTVYSSARDIGNIAAGYIAGANGMSWEASRIAFDAFQSKVSGRPSIEGISTRNAEYYGWRIGSNILNNTPTQKANNLLKSIWDWITK